MVGYVQLAHNRRVEGVTRAEVLLNLGREDELDVDGLRRLAASITRYADGGGAAAPLGDRDDGGEPAGELVVQSSRALGGVWLLDALWRRLGVDEALGRVLGARRFGTDPAGEAGAPAFRAYGHSKDHRPDLPQVVIGLAVTREGIPVRVWVWPGNTNDMSVVKQVKDDLRGWRLGRVVTVVDRGFSSDENLRYLTRGGGHWIAGEKMRDGAPDAQAALSRQGRYQTVRDNLRVKEVGIGEGDAAKRFVVCHNPTEADRDKQAREDTIARLQAELERIKTARAKTRASDAKTSTAHHRAECALRDHPTLGRYLRQTPTGRLLIDRAKIKAEERLDGKYLLSTSDPDLSAEDVALGYKNLLEAERGFRDLKATLELRPVFHRLEHRIRAHILLCWLALLMIRLAERQTGQTWRRIALELRRLHQVTLTGPAGTVAHTTTLTDPQRQILTALKIDPPPPVTALTPA